jgi:hypothetical protein
MPGATKVASVIASSLILLKPNPESPAGCDSERTDGCNAAAPQAQ